MRIEARLFELLTVFFAIVTIIYAVFTALSGSVEWGGTTALALTFGLSLIISTYFRFVARRLDTRPEDYEEAEVSDGAGDLGFFSPGSWWPILIALSAGLFAVAFALAQFWLVVVAAGCLVAAAAGLVFEYHIGPERH